MGLILHKVGLELPPRMVYGNVEWVRWFIEFTGNSGMTELRNKLFEIFEFLTANFRLEAYNEINLAMDSVHIKHTWDIADVAKLFSIKDLLKMIAEYLYKGYRDKIFLLPWSVLVQFREGVNRYKT